MDCEVDCETSERRYRSVYKYLRIGSKEYAVLDAELAQQRAHAYFVQALELLQLPLEQQNHNEINRSLLLATDFGSKDAPFVIALRILDAEVSVPFLAEEVVVFLKKAAERGHSEAAYQLACSYAGMGTFKGIEAMGEHYFVGFSQDERAKLAEHYFIDAIELGHPDAAEELIIAYAYGRGAITQNVEAFIALCEQQATCGNQPIILGYAAWLAGMTVEGRDPLPEAIKIPLNREKALRLLLLASRGANLCLAQHALHLICIGIRRSIWGNERFSLLKSKLIQDALQGNQLLALYFGWYAVPEAQRMTFPKVLENYQLVELKTLIRAHREEAIAFLDAALSGPDEDVATLAKEVLAWVFGRCFMAEDGRLVFDEQSVV